MVVLAWLARAQAACTYACTGDSGENVNVDTQVPPPARYRARTPLDTHFAIAVAAARVGHGVHTYALCCSRRLAHGLRRLDGRLAHRRRPALA